MFPHTQLPGLPAIHVSDMFFSASRLGEDGFTLVEQMVCFSPRVVTWSARVVDPTVCREMYPRPYHMSGVQLQS